MTGRLTVATLGPLRAYTGEREIVLGPPKQRAVFAVLALRNNSVVSRDELVDHIWGESPPATAAGSLHTYVSGLRRALAGLGEPLTGARDGYVLRLDPDRLDLRVVERLVTRARAARARQETTAAVNAYAEALSHWQPGAALGGLPGPFAAGHRLRVAELRLQLVVEHAELLLALGEADTVAGRLQEHVAANPHHERLRALLITALHRCGQTADALAQYHDLRRRLADDLGIDPSAQVQELYASLLNDNTEQPAANVRPAQLPRDTAHFVGRSAAVREVLGAAPRLAMIVGVGGVGKTALALHCAHLLAADYPDGQLYVNLRGFDPRHPARSPSDALHHLLTSVTTRRIPDDPEERGSLWRSLVQEKKMLVLLDNAERADQVYDLLPGGGPSFVIVTSRNRLSGLAVRYAARRVALSPLTTEESVRLLADSIGSARIEAEPVAAQRLAQLCDHLPLALRIAAEQVLHRSNIGEVITDLEDVRDRLDGLQIPNDELHSVRGVLSWSYARLDAAASHAFRMLGLYPGVSICVEAAAALLDISRQAAAAVLRSLADQHLVETAGRDYWMHDLTRIYAGEVSKQDAVARKPALERVMRWYISTLATAEGRTPSHWFPLPSADDTAAPLPLADQNELVAWCAREWDNISALLRAAQRAGCHEQVWQLAYLLYSYFYTTGRGREWVETLRIGLRSAELTGNRKAHQSLLNILGVAHSRLGQHDVAVQQLQRLVNLVEPGDELSLAIYVGNLAELLREAKRYEEAMPHAQQALDLAIRLGPDDYLEAGSLDLLCELHAALGGFAEALRFGERGLAPARRLPSAIFEANILIHMGVAAHGLGDADTALGYFQDALAVCESSGNHYHEGRALFELAKARLAAADHRAAYELATRALLRLRGLDAAEVADVMQFLRSLGE